MSKKNKGFTLIEMMIVVAIIGIIASFMIFSVSRALKQSRDKRREIDVNAIITQLNMYYAKHKSYPTLMSELETDGYMTLPTDPKGVVPYVYNYQQGPPCQVSYKSEITGGQVDRPCK